MKYLLWIRYPAYFVVGGVALHWLGEKVGVLRDPPDMSAFQWQPARDRDPRAYTSLEDPGASTNAVTPAVVPNPAVDGIRLETQPHRPEETKLYAGGTKDFYKDQVSHNYFMPSLPVAEVRSPEAIKTIRDTLLRPQIIGKPYLLRKDRQLL